jgi:alpha-beta hydrolase superfamily lysophospholipase
MSKPLESVETIELPSNGLRLEGEFIVPPNASGLVIFAHGSGSSRHSPRNQFVARTLRAHGLGTLLFDLLTEEEESEDRVSGAIRFNIGLLAQRLSGASERVQLMKPGLPIGYFGSSTGAAAALVAASAGPNAVRAIVSRGGRPDLAGAALAQIKASTLLIVGGEDPVVIKMNEEAFARLACAKDMRIIPGATHLFEEPGALEQVAKMAADWFDGHLSN